MPRKIFKYPLALTDDYQKIPMPAGANIVEVAAQAGAICLWAEFNEPIDEATSEDRYFRVYGTGHPIHDPEASFVGTAHSPPFVWHVYETKK